MAEILIVEDDADLAATLADLLALEGHTTRIAHDGRAGLRAIEEHLPDLVLLDIEMPVMDGPGMAAECIAEDAGKERIPIILSSGYSDLATVADRLGTPYRLSKPSSLEALSDMVALALEEGRPPQPPAPFIRTDGEVHP